MLDTAKSIAEFLNCSVAKIRKDTRLTDIPRIRLGRAVRYERNSVLAWLQAQEEKRRNGENN